MKREIIKLVLPLITLCLSHAILPNAPGEIEKVVFDLKPAAAN